MVVWRLKLAFLLALFLLGCAATGYHTPKELPTLGKDGWPVGIWRNEDGDTIKLYEDGTGEWTQNITSIVNKHVVWKYGHGELRIDRWIMTTDEAAAIKLDDVPIKVLEDNDTNEYRKKEGTDRRKSAKKNRVNKNKKIQLKTLYQIKNYYTSEQSHDWMIFNNVVDGVLSLSGYLYYPKRSFSYDSHGDLNRIENKGINSILSIYTLVEKTSSQYLAKLDYEQQRLQNQAFVQADNMAKRIQEAATQNSHKRLAVFDINSKLEKQSWLIFRELDDKLKTSKLFSLVEMELLKETIDELRINVADLVGPEDDSRKTINILNQIMDLTGADAVVVLNLIDQNDIQASYLSKETNKTWSFKNTD